MQQDVHPAKPGQGGLEDFIGRVRLDQVDGHSQPVCVGVRQPFPQLGQLIRIGAHQHQARLKFCQAVGHEPPQSACRAGNHHGTVIERPCDQPSIRKLSI